MRTATAEHARRRPGVGASRLIASLLVAAAAATYAGNARADDFAGTIAVRSSFGENRELLVTVRDNQASYSPDMTEVALLIAKRPAGLLEVRSADWQGHRCDVNAGALNGFNVRCTGLSVSPGGKVDIDVELVDSLQKVRADVVGSFVITRGTNGGTGGPYRLVWARAPAPMKLPAVKLRSISLRLPPAGSSEVEAVQFRLQPGPHAGSRLPKLSFAPPKGSFAPGTSVVYGLTPPVKSGAGYDFSVLIAVARAKGAVGGPASLMLNGSFESPLANFAPRRSGDRRFDFTPGAAGTDAACHELAPLVGAGSSWSSLALPPIATLPPLVPWPGLSAKQLALDTFDLGCNPTATPASFLRGLNATPFTSSLSPFSVRLPRPGSGGIEAFSFHLASTRALSSLRLSFELPRGSFPSGLDVVYGLTVPVKSGSGYDFSLLIAVPRSEQAVGGPSTLSLIGSLEHPYVAAGRALREVRRIRFEPDRGGDPGPGKGCQALGTLFESGTGWTRLALGSADPARPIWPGLTPKELAIDTFDLGCNPSATPANFLRGLNAGP